MTMLRVTVLALIVATAVVHVAGQGSPAANNNDDDKPDLSLESRTGPSNGTNSLRVEFLGRSGQMKLFMAGNSTRWIKLKMGKLVEVAATGKKTKNKVTSFAGQQFTWTQSAAAKIGGANGTNATTAQVVSFSSTLSVRQTNVPFVMTTYIVANETAVQQGNTTIFVPANSLKWTISISNWPFEAPDNVLLFSMDVLTSSGHKPKDARPVDDSDVNDNLDLGSPLDDNDDNDNDTTSRSSDKGKSPKSKTTPKSKGVSRLNFGDDAGSDGFFDLPTTALLDGAEANITVGVGVRGAHTIISWVFPKFTTLVYDPVAVSDPVGAESTTASTTSSSDDGNENIIMGAIAGVVVLFVIVVIAAIFASRRRTSARSLESAPVAAAAPAASAAPTDATVLGSSSSSSLSSSSVTSSSLSSSSLSSSSVTSTSASASATSTSASASATSTSSSSGGFGNSSGSFGNSSSGFGSNSGGFGNSSGSFGNSSSGFGSNSSSGFGNSSSS